MLFNVIMGLIIFYVVSFIMTTYFMIYEEVFHFYVLEENETIRKKVIPIMIMSRAINNSAEYKMYAKMMFGYAAVCWFMIFPTVVYYVKRLLYKGDISARFTDKKEIAAMWRDIISYTEDSFYEQDK